ncbi:unnamed protein product [Danaus chrysippus]|uniref:(African queen) hypothetical protein n=1 Tax=Danaus chrysippus TaxID=151541 RepID=A0A8J2R435_9NEOP|nr:unnamed protein product [Danaus chrysippus]
MVADFLDSIYLLAVWASKLPVFTKDMDNLALSESLPVGDVVYTLQGMTDPEGLPIKYGLVGTDKFAVNADTGNVTLVHPLDREKEDTIKFLVSLENSDPASGQTLVQTQSVTVIIVDENDNPPLFKNSPYEVNVAEDEVVGTTVLSNITVEDIDSVGEALEVGCVANEQWPEACDLFEVVSLHSTANEFTGALVLKRSLDYNEKQFYQFQLHATDGTLNSSSPVEVKVVDVQNTPPVFSGALSAALPEDAPVGSLALIIKAKDGDRAQPRDVKLELVTNPMEYFVLDSKTGELRTAKPLDREALADPNSPLNITVKAIELVDGIPLDSPSSVTLGYVAITIRDVNDEPPRFNRREYSVELLESLARGTPLPHLDMVVTDTDLGMNSVFSLRLADNLGAFVVEPSLATGSATVTLRLNSTLDYEDPNQRKFILEVIAEEVHTSPPLSSKASVIVSVKDVNDNSPEFADDAYSAGVREDAPPGTRLAAVKATDRDTGRFGTEGIVYQLSGNGAELFSVEPRSGVISVAECEHPGSAPCIDYETRKEYFLQYKATDADGTGQSSVVSLQVSVRDSNDNPPVFLTPVYRASIDEDATKFEPELQVQARDLDPTSDIRYSIVSPHNPPFWVEPTSGRISVLPGKLLDATDNKYILTVMASDGRFNATCRVEVTVRDVNDHPPVFATTTYDASVSEDAAIGTEVAAVQATDLDSGMNAQIRYNIQKGALDAFNIHQDTGLVSVAGSLDYDRRNTYKILITATDMGVPSLTGTTELTVHVLNVNDKKPVFKPAVQRAGVSADAEAGTLVYQLVAEDPDAEPGGLRFTRGDKPARAVDANGQEVIDDGTISSWFIVSPSGEVFVSHSPDRSRAAVVTLPVAVTDTSAPIPQTTDGELIITIVDVNRQPPVFSQPAYVERLAEEQPPGTLLATYSATDKETPIASITIHPPSPYFRIDNVTGEVRVSSRIDYEATPSLNFTLVAHDSGVPQLSSSAAVFVEIININDEKPVFSDDVYNATLEEHSTPGTRVLNVTAVDLDAGDFGKITYSLSGESASLFTINQEGEVTVAEGADIDREATSELWFRVVATDNAPPQTKKSSSVPVHVILTDINDNPPVFSQRVYKGSVSENVPLSPPPALLQLRAEDPDQGVYGTVTYSIEEQSEPGVFRVDPQTGILSPVKPVVGGALYRLVVAASDGTHNDTARVDITVLSVNKHSPVFVQPPLDVRRIEIPAHSAQAGYLVTTIQVTDEDSGENGRVTYHLKVDNQNVGHTEEFSLDPVTGQLTTRVPLDIDNQVEYQLIVSASDGGTPSQFESLRVLQLVVVDDQDHAPAFIHRHYHFSVTENLPSGVIVGTVKAIDKDRGDNGKVYYHILEGNQDGAFTLDRTQGIIRTSMSFDREKQDEYSMTVYASNNPILEHAAAILNSIDNSTESQDVSVTTIKIRILDENDNEPKFEQKIYYAGVSPGGRVGEVITSLVVRDPDLGVNGSLLLAVAASHLYKFGSTTSSGSVVPSPFNITQDGVLTTATLMSDYRQDRFVLDVIAQELAPPHRRDTAQVYIWIIDRSSLLRLVVSRPCSSAGAPHTRLSAAARALLVPGRKAAVHTAGDGRWCELQLHAVDPVTFQVLDVRRVLEDIDAQYDALRQLYQEYGVETLTAAASGDKAPDSFDPALAALIALLIVLFTGIVTFIVVCACLKHWATYSRVVPPPSLQSSKGDSLARRRILEELSTTENPLWLETKLRPYEEQELTMNVFGDTQEHIQEQNPVVDNTYATIEGGRSRCGDYATLTPDLHQLEHATTALEAALGFQGSTFKPERETPEPPPRP